MSFKNEIFIDTCVFYALISGNDQITKISKEILDEFKNYLKQEKASQITIKNYLSDLRHFLNWLELAT